MDVKSAVLLPVVAGALMWIIEMLLPEGRISRAAVAVAGIIALQAIIVPMLAWLGGKADSSEIEARAYISASEIIKSADELPGGIAAEGATAEGATAEGATADVETPGQASGGAN